MEFSEMLRSDTKLFVRAAGITVLAVLGFVLPVIAQEKSTVAANEKLHEDNAGGKHSFEDSKNAWQGRKNEDLSFENDTGKGQGHEEGKSGVRTGHNDDMPGQRQGHRKDESLKTGDNKDKSDVTPGSILDKIGGDKHARRRDNDNNPPGSKGGPGTKWENKPGPRGGPGKSPDKTGEERRIHRRDNDNNPPGSKGGPGTNWENKPGPRGGPGKSPDRIGGRKFRGGGKFSGGCSQDGDQSGQKTGSGKRKGRKFRGGGKFSGDCSQDGDQSGQKTGSGKRKGRKTETVDNSSGNDGSGLKNAKPGKGSNGLHIGNRKNGAGKGIKNYSGTNPGKGNRQGMSEKPAKTARKSGKGKK